MSEQIESRILQYLREEGGSRALRPRRLARELDLHDDDTYPAFREALRQLMREGRVVLGARGAVVLPTQTQSRNLIVGTYRHNRRGFGFVVPADPESHEDLFIPEGYSAGALDGDTVAAQIARRGQRNGQAICEGRITRIIERARRRFAGTLQRQHNQWVVLPDGNVLTQPIEVPDAGSRRPRAGSKVVVELTRYPSPHQSPQGVIVEVLGQEGEKDVDLRCIIVQHNLPEEFPPEALEQARLAVDEFAKQTSWPDRYDLSDEVICTIDPDDARDFDDAISLHRRDDGRLELGVHIADVSYFVPPDSPLDLEARKRGNSVYFPQHVIPMLPELLSNGVCSLQEDMPRLCKSVFITFDDQGRPAGTRFANTVIRSTARLRYREAQALIDDAETIPHPDGPRRIGDYNPAVVRLLREMDALARRIRKRRLAQGQIVLDLPEVELVLDENGRVVGAVPEDDSFTHTIIEMFMVEANEAVARLLDSLNVPFMRRIHPGPDVHSAERLRHFIQVAGYRLPRELDHRSIQAVLEAVRGKPQAYAVNLAILKSISRAEYSPRDIGHFALASECYCHFTSPIRRYADITVHRLLDSYLRQRDAGGVRRRRSQIQLDNVVSHSRLVEIGRHISFTERRAEDAERELRQVKVLELLKDRIGEVFAGVVTGITSFGIFVQLQQYLIEGLIRYENLLDDWWDVDERSGVIRGQRTGRRIGIGDPVSAFVVRVDVPRRELDLGLVQTREEKKGPARRGRRA